MVICLSTGNINSWDDVVKMDDVYKSYGEDKGTFNNSCEEFFTMAYDVLDIISSTDFIKAGEVGPGPLVEVLTEELKNIQSSLKDFSAAKRKDFEIIRNLQINALYEKQKQNRMANIG